MTNLAQSITTSATRNPQVLVRGEPPPAQMESGPVVVNDFLKLSGGVPQTVNVTLFVDSTTNVVTVTFSQKGGPKFTQGIIWNPDEGYALMITFELSSNIKQLIPTTPSLWFSDTFLVDITTNQACCVMPVFGEYHFAVDPAPETGLLRLVDPKIVVTPIVTP